MVPRDGLITVEDLLRSPALQLRLLAGESGTGRRVAWAHVSELEDPTPWLFGSEMIMTTGMALPRSAAGQRLYLERLDDAGVVCLAVSERMFVPTLTASFSRRRLRAAFPWWRCRSRCRSWPSPRRWRRRFRARAVSG